MDIKKLQDQLTIDEGVRYKIYLDSKNLPTCGIGHLIIKSDPEYKQPVGTPVNLERVQELFAKDIQICIKECQSLFKDWDSMVDELQEILANMMFNLGLARFSGFHRFIEAIENKDYKEAAAQMKDSAWFNQVGIRAQRLYNRMLAL